MMVVFIHLALALELTNIVSQYTFWGSWTLTFFLLHHLFLVLTSILPSYTATLLILHLGLIYQLTTNLLTYLSTICFLTKPLPGQDLYFSWLNILHLNETFIFLWWIFFVFQKNCYFFLAKNLFFQKKFTFFSQTSFIFCQSL